MQVWKCAEKTELALHQPPFLSAPAKNVSLSAKPFGENPPKQSIFKNINAQPALTLNCRELNHKIGLFSGIKKRQNISSS